MLTDIRNTKIVFNLLNTKWFGEFDDVSFPRKDSPDPLVMVMKLGAIELYG